jgi:hypothetical protein
VTKRNHFNLDPVIRIRYFARTEPARESPGRFSSKQSFPRHRKHLEEIRRDRFKPSHLRLKPPRHPGTYATPNGRGSKALQRSGVAFMI